MPFNDGDCETMREITFTLDPKVESMLHQRGIKAEVDKEGRRIWRFDTRHDGKAETRTVTLQDHPVLGPHLNLSEWVEGDGITRESSGKPTTKRVNQALKWLVYVVQTREQVFHALR